MIIYKADTTQRADVTPDNGSKRSHKMLGENLINLSFTLETYVDFSVGDYVNFGTTTYTVLKQPIAKREKSNKWVYNIDFFAPEYLYDNALYILEGETDFYLRGQLGDFIELIVTNMNRLGSGYLPPTVPSGTAWKNLNFNGESCLQALQKVVKEYDMEYKLSADGKQITVGEDLGAATGLSFQFKAGLRNIERKELNDGVFVTRLYAYGSERNTIASTYGHKRLRLASPYYLEQNTVAFGVIEKHKIFEEVYPRRTGTLTSVDAGNELIFTDSSMDFDVNAQLMTETAKITFNTGYLSGYEFEIFRYDDVAKEFEIIPIVDDQDTTLPNATRKPVVGDEYVLHDIKMPQTYITAAEAELTAEATAYLNRYSTPNVVYAIKPDPVYFETNLISLEVGDLITIVDTDFGINISTKIIDLDQNLNNPYQYDITVGAEATVTYLTRVLDGVSGLNDNITAESIDRRRTYFKTAQKIRDLNTVTDSIFDPTDNNYFDPAKIKPASIDTLALTVGAMPLQLNFDGLEIETNYLGDENQLRLSSCTMVHFVIKPTPQEWTITGNTFNIGDNLMRYVYVEANEESPWTGAFLVTTDQRKVDHTPTNYTFLIGILHAVDGTTNTRGFSPVYGQTFINGRFITTGRIQSLDTLNYLDLDTNQFNLGDAQNGIDWNVTTANTLTIRGAIIQSQSGSSFPQFVYRGTYDNATTYYEGDGVEYNGSTYLYINGTATAGNVPDISPTHWDLIASAGSDGNDGLPGVDGQDGQDAIQYWTWIKYADDVNGNGMSDSPLNKEYIGIAYNQTQQAESTNPLDYTWALIKGDPGQDGLPGVDGDDGLTYYTWIKYADTPTTGMSDDPAGKQYLGISYNNLSPTESLNYGDYSWSLIKGETGPQGPAGNDGNDGADGINGVTYYTWIKYAYNSTGTSGLSDDPTGRDYIGIAYNNTSPVESTNPVDYQWSLYVGSDGVQGPSGANGESLYTWIKYADTPSTGMSDDPTGKDYIGLAYNKTSATESTNYLDYSWSLVKGADGSDGTNGTNGTNGAPGADGIDAPTYLQDFATGPPVIGGRSDAIIYLDTDLSGVSNPGEVTIDVSYIEDSKGVERFNFPKRIRFRAITDFGEGRAGLFILVWMQETMDSRYFARVASWDNSYLMPAYHNGTSWVVATNDGYSQAATFATTDVVMAVVEAKQTTGGLTGCQLYYTGGTALDTFNPASHIFSFAEISNQYDFQRQWDLLTASGEITVVTGSDLMGGKSIQFGNNSGNDQVWIVSKQRFPYDPNTLYRIAARARRTAGTGVIYVGVIGYDGAGNYVNITGGNSSGSQHYFAAGSETPSDTNFRIYEGFFKGKAASGNGTEHFSINDPGTCHTNVEYIAPMVLMNYNSLAGIYQVDWVRLDILEAPPVANATWSNGVEYIPGSTVFHRGRIYQCTRRTTFEPPNSAVWVEIGVRHAYNYRGDYSTSATYYWTDEVCDIVKNGGVWYRNATFGSTLMGTWNAAEWETWGAQFEMVATDTLLAENANIAGFKYANSRMESQNQSSGSANPLLYMDGNNARIIARDDYAGYYGTEEIVFDINPQSGYVQLTQAAVGNSTGVTQRMRADGFYVKSPGISTGYDGPITPYCAIVGEGAFNNSSHTAGIAGLRYAGQTNSWGGVFERLMTTSLFVDHTGTTSSITLNRDTCFVMCNNTSSITITLPSSTNRFEGQVIIIYRGNSGGVTVSGNGTTIRKGSSTIASDGLGASGRGALCIWTGSVWAYMYIGL